MSPIFHDSVTRLNCVMNVNKSWLIHEFMGFHFMLCFLCSCPKEAKGYYNGAKIRTFRIPDLKLQRYRVDVPGAPAAPGCNNHPKAKEKLPGCFGTTDGIKGGSILSD